MKLLCVVVSVLLGAKGIQLSMYWLGKHFDDDKKLKELNRKHQTTETQKTPHTLRVSGFLQIKETSQVSDKVRNVREHKLLITVELMQEVQQL